MSTWVRRLRGAVGMGVTWAVVWAVVGVLIGVASAVGIPMEWFTDVFDAPLPALALPGFVSGAVFSLVLGIAGRRRRFEDLSLPLFAVWGGLGGLLVGLLPLAVAGLALASPSALVALGTLSVLSAGSATATLVVARAAEDGGGGDRLLEDG